MSLGFLQTLGITETEGSLYELLLKLGEVPITTVIRESKLKRPTVYKALHSLSKKGLVIQRDIKKKLHVRPEPPSKLQELADKQYRLMEEVKLNLNAMMPGLALSYTHSTDKPIVRIYEGIEGLKEVYEDTVKVGKPISAILHLSSIDPELHEWLIQKFVKKRVKAKIHVKAIVASGMADKDYMKRSPQEYRITRQVDSSLYPFQHEIDIYGDKIAIIHYNKDEPLIGIIIQHPAIANTMQAWFDLAWNGAHD